MASSSTLNVDACMILTQYSTPSVFAKDQRSYRYEDLNLAIENPVDLEGLRVNGFPEVVDLFKKQGMDYYFDVMNGPTYTELVKEFWMKASVITKDKYIQRIKDMIKEKPELEGKTPKEMGLKPFVSTEIESFVAGFRISIKLCHIYEALKLESGGLIIRNAEEIGSDVEEFIYKPKADPKDKFEMTNNCKVIYKILIDSIMSKLGGTDQVSNFQKLFTFHVGKGNFLDIGRLIFIHLADSILSTKSIVRHSRLLNHMFAQCGLLDAIKPFLPGYATFLTSSKVVNSTTLRYLKLVKSNQIVHPTHPLLLRDTEDNIAECRLVHVSDSKARKIIEAHAEYLKKLGAEVGTGEPTELTVRQARILGQPTRVQSVKRKVVKSPAGKKVSKTQKTTVPKPTKKSKARKLVLHDLTEEEKERAALLAAVEKVEKLKEKEKDLKDSYEFEIDASEFDDMYNKLNLSERDALRNMSSSFQLYGPADAQASGSTAQIIQNLDKDEDSDRTPSPHPAKYQSKTNNKIAQEQPSPDITENQPSENDQHHQTPPPADKPQTPPPEHDHSDHETHKSPEPIPDIPNDEVTEKPNSEAHDGEKSPHHVVLDSSCTIPTPLKHHFQQINDNMNQDVIQKTPPNQTNHLKHLMQDLSLDCIYIPPHLPSRITNEPLAQTQDDISKFLMAVDKNI
ncbi:NADH:ubiquinone reductase (H(+)-translocating) [Trifolium repens]|nr:NADH:ubiquinone reductase (H(+)-translocating) [Trifolium repens]